MSNELQLALAVLCVLAVLAMILWPNDRSGPPPAPMVFPVPALPALPEEKVRRTRAALTPREIVLMFQLKNEGRTQAEIAEVIGVSQATVSRIVRSAAGHDVGGYTA